MRLLVAYFLIFVSTLSCEKNDPPPPECVTSGLAPIQPYSNPVWHPNGQLLGFNHTPLAGIDIDGVPPCVWYTYKGKADSTGFYLMNKDGSGFKRVTNFKLSAPAWSPDGNWLAFSLGPNIYKMPFNGTTFDTTQMIKLTSSGGNFFPSWTANSDTIYFDSNNGSTNGGYYIWKMDSSGNGKVGFPNTGREPFVSTDNRIYYLGLQAEVFSMNKDGSDRIQLTNNGNINGTATTKSLPKYFNGKIFYQQNGIWSSFINGLPKKIDSLCLTYSISTNGEIVFSRTDFNSTVYNKQIGTLWIMNADGSNKRQLTFNNF